MYFDNGKSFVTVNDLLKYSPHVWFPHKVNYDWDNVVLKYNISQVWKRIHH